MKTSKILSILMALSLTFGMVAPTTVYAEELTDNRVTEVMQAEGALLNEYEMYIEITGEVRTDEGRVLTQKEIPNLPTEKKSYIIRPDSSIDAAEYNGSDVVKMFTGSNSSSTKPGQRRVDWEQRSRKSQLAHKAKTAFHQQWTKYLLSPWLFTKVAGTRELSHEQQFHARTHPNHIPLTCCSFF